MKKHILIFHIFLVVLIARENPFIPVKIEKKVEETKVEIKKFKPYPFMQIQVLENGITLNVDDVKKRSFTVKNPYKIVIDFTRKNKIRTKTLKINSEWIEKISFGRHPEYYRMVIVPAKNKQKYSIQKTEEGYYIELEK